MPNLEIPKLGLTNLSHHLRRKALLDHLVWISIYHISLSGWIQQLQLKLTWSWANIKVSFRSSVAEALVITYQSEFQNLYWNTRLWKKVDGKTLSLLFFCLMLSYDKISLLYKWAGFSDCKLRIQRIILFQLLRPCFILVDCLAYLWPGSRHEIIVANCCSASNSFLFISHAVTLFPPRQ